MNGQRIIELTKEGIINTLNAQSLQSAILDLLTKKDWQAALEGLDLLDTMFDQRRKITVEMEELCPMPQVEPSLKDVLAEIEHDKKVNNTLRKMAKQNMKGVGGWNY